VLDRLRKRLLATASYDVFPEFSAKVRRLLYNPLGVLSLAALAALFCGLFLHPQGFVLFGGMLAVILLGTAWPWLSLRGIHGEVSFDRSRASEDDPVDVYLTLRNRLPWGAWGLAVRNGFIKQPKGGDPLPPVATIASAPRRRSARCRWSFVPACRGVYPLTSPQLTTGFPFGLWEKKRLLAVQASLIVWPRTFPVGPVPLVSGDQQIEGNVSRNKVGSNGDVLGVRPYRRGDSPRRIHWSQSARHDRLIVCELQSNARPVIQLVLDADCLVHAGDGPDGSREWAIRIVASLAKGWLQAGAQVGAVWNGHVVAPASGQQQVHRLLDGLAKLEDKPGPTLGETLASSACRTFRDGLQVIVTTDIALAQRGWSFHPDDQQHWVILRAAAFGKLPSNAFSPSPNLPLRPWLLIESADQIAAQLRGGWKEAQHGS
jgi:uncharacterized protein (DUF58 family)